MRAYESGCAGYEDILIHDLTLQNVSLAVVLAMNANYHVRPQNGKNANSKSAGGRESGGEFLREILHKKKCSDHSPASVCT